MNSCGEKLPFRTALFRCPADADKILIMLMRYLRDICFLLWLPCAAIGMETPDKQAASDLVIDAACLHSPPPGVRIGKAVKAVVSGDAKGLDFQREGIIVPVTTSLTAASGTVRTRFQLPSNWPQDDRSILFHAGDQSHVHVSLLVQAGQLIAVYKAGEENYTAIKFRASADWEAGSWHDLTFRWRAKKGAQSVDLYLEVDERLVGQQSGRLISEWPETGYVGARRQGQTWQGVIGRVHLSPTYTPPRELRPGRREIVVDTGCSDGECYNFWSINNYTSQHMFANPGYRAQARRDKPFMRYVNCVRLLGGRIDGRNAWFKGSREDGTIECDFSGLLEYLRGIQDAGYTPRIVLDNIPTAMSEPGELAKYGNTRPAKDLNVWHAYVRQAVTAMVDAFGVETVSRWRFRVGTEPDLNPGHWMGTKTDYLRHYDCTVDAVCSVLAEAEIGPGNILNPALASVPNAQGQKPWGLEIVDHCATGKNTWTGETGTRICFLECSWYGQVGRSIDSLDVAIERMRDRLARYPQLADLPVSIAEFAILQDEHGRRLYGGDITEWGASWYAAVADRVYEMDVRQVHEWSQATTGILHPRTQVIEMLEQMQGGRRLRVSVKAQSAARAGAISCMKDGKYYVVLYNHRPYRSPSVPEHIDLTIRIQDPHDAKQWTLSQWGIDRDHGVFVHQLYADCQYSGIEPLPDSPIYGGNLTLRFGPSVRQIVRQNQARYTAMASPAAITSRQPLEVTGGVAKIAVPMPGHSVRLLVISPN